MSKKLSYKTNNYSINQSINQSTIQLFNQSTNQQSIDWSINQSANSCLLEAAKVSGATGLRESVQDKTSALRLNKHVIFYCWNQQYCYCVLACSMLGCSYPAIMSCSISDQVLVKGRLTCPGSTVACVVITLAELVDLHISTYQSETHMANYQAVLVNHRYSLQLIMWQISNHFLLWLNS